MSKEPIHILVIRLSAMGDVAMTVPVLSAFFKKYPDVKITFLTRSFFLPMFQQFPNVTVYSVDVQGKHKGFLGLWRLYKELKGLNINVVADLHNVLRSNVLKRFFIFTSIPFAQINKGRAEKKALTALKNKVFDKPLKTTHQRYVDVFNALGFSFDLSRAVPVKSLSFSDKVHELTNDTSIINIGIAPFAAFKGKMYPIELMEKVIVELNKNYAYQIFLFGGGAKEIKKLNSFESKYERVTSCAGKLSFKDELALISRLNLMVAMDSGNGHLAAMYGVPVLTLWGVTHPYAGFSPFNYGKNKALLANREVYPLIPTSIYGNKMPDGYENAMSTIRSEEVVKNIQKLVE